MTYVQWIVYAMLEVISLFLVAMPTSNPESNIVQSLGPKMCDRLCSHRIGCSGHLFSLFDLSCRLIVGKRSISGQLSSEGANNYKVFKACCMNENVIEQVIVPDLIRKLFSYSGANPLLCLYHGSSDVTIYSSVQIRRSGLETYTRLLILPISTVTLGARQFYLGNKSVATYPNLQVIGVIGVAYVTSMRKLLISSASLNLLFTVSLDDKKKSIIIMGKRISEMAVDDEKQLVFLASHFSRGIYTMTTEGTNYRLLKNLEQNVRSIAIDCQTQVIYTTVSGKHILKLTYKGVSQEIVVKGDINSAICLNSNGSVLYYFKRIHKYKLFKLSLPNGIPSEIPTSFRPYAYTMYVFSSKLYLTPDNNKVKLFVLGDSGKQIRLINTGYDSHIFRVVVCDIP